MFFLFPLSKSFTDPLTQEYDPEIIPVNHNKFSIALEQTLLSVSPYSKFPLPYLETEMGKCCALRSRFPAELYYSKAWSEDKENSHKHDEKIKSEEVDFNETSSS